MNRYLLRSLVAVLTFSIGVAIGSFGSRSSRQNRFRHRECDHKYELRVRGDYVPQKRFKMRAGPFLSVDTLSTDPLKLTYSSTTPVSNDIARQRVEFSVRNSTKREIVGFTVGYKSGWRSMNQGGQGWVLVGSRPGLNNPTSGGLDSVAIECNGEENLTVWVSSVEFKDGSRWSNDRHQH